MASRMTHQRMKILQHLKSVKTHPTAEAVYDAVKKELPTLTLATVYRNLNLLADQGEIMRFEVNNHFRYDADKGRHQHCVCRSCGKIIDMFDKKIHDYAMKQFSKKGFEPSCVCIIYNGICKECNK